jgi:CrcB protein
MASRADWPVLAVIAAGGALGALGRYGLTVAWPPGPAGFPVATLAVNVSGCLAIGALLTVVDRRRTGRLTRPFLGTGVLGGYTTFSAYVLDTFDVVAAGRPLVAAAYLGGTVLAALAATWLGAGLTEAALDAAHHRRERP